MVGIQEESGLVSYTDGTPLMEFDTFEDYEQAVSQGKVPEGTPVYISEDSNKSTSYLKNTNILTLDEIAASTEPIDYTDKVAATSDVCALKQSLNDKAKLIEGTLSDATGDYTIANVIPSGYIPIQAYYKTTYNQWRPLTVGYISTTLVIQDAISSMANRPYRVIVIDV